MKSLLNDKLGITFESVTTGPHSDFGRYDRALTETEMNYIQNMVNQVYDDFTGSVEKGRGLDSAYVESIAQGRVWAAPQALKNGLIDGYAGIRECVKIAANSAKSKDYVLDIYPRERKFLSRLFGDYEANATEKALVKEFGMSYIFLKQLRNAAHASGIQMRVPYNTTIQ
jgi:protease-4